MIDANVGHIIFEITCKPSKIDQFIAIMGPLGLIEVCRTGIAALNRGEAGCEGRGKKVSDYAVVSQFEIRLA